MSLIGVLFNKKENELYQQIKNKNKQDLFNWNLANVVFPFATFLITVLILAYTPRSQKAETYYSILFNGVLPLISINILIASSFFLIKFDKQKETKRGIETSRTRLKLIFYAFVAYLFASSLFVIQNIYTPFENGLGRTSQLVYSIISIYISLAISNWLFLLQDDMIEKSYESNIASKVKDLKDVLQ